MKVRTYAKSSSELWLCEYRNPLVQDVSISDSATFLESLQQPIESQRPPLYVDKINTGFLTWAPSVKGYLVVSEKSPKAVWDESSEATLDCLQRIFGREEYLSSLTLLWSQESNRSGGATELRGDNIAFIKTLGKFWLFVLNVCFTYAFLQPKRSKWTFCKICSLQSNR